MPFFTLPPDKKTWCDIAFTVGLTDTEALEAYENFGANGWKRANNIKLESWEQIKYVLGYWKNHRHRFDKKSDSGKKKLFPIKGKFCGESGCGMPAYFKDIRGEHTNHKCLKHSPQKVRDEYEQG